MSGLSVHLDTGSSAPLLAVEVLDARTGSRTTHTLADGETSTIDLTPGNYLVRAVTPDGTVLSDQATVDGESPASVRLQPRAGSTGRPVREPVRRRLLGSASTQRWSGRDLLAAAGSRVMDLLPGELAISAVRTPTALIASRRRPRLWGRLWTHREPDGWQPLDWSPVDVARVAGGADIRLTLPAREVHALAVGARGLASRIIILPPAEEVLVRARMDGPRRLRLSAARADDHDPRSATAESLLAYLTSGQLTSASLISDPVISDAEELLFAKLADPLAAVIGGLFLLRTRALERLHDWPQNLANWFGWLPDASVVHVGQLLAEKEVRRDELRHRLLTAAGAGVPVYTDSLQWLYEGLLLFAPTVPDDQEVQAALARVRGYAMACDWRTALTTFAGPSPGEPTSDEQQLRRRPPGWAPLVPARAHAAGPTEDHGHGEPAGGVPATA